MYFFGTKPQWWLSERSPEIERRQCPVLLYTEPNRSRRAPSREGHLDPQFLTGRSRRWIFDVFGNEVRDGLSQRKDLLPLAKDAAHGQVTCIGSRSRHERLVSHGEIDGHVSRVATDRQAVLRVEPPAEAGRSVHGSAGRGRWEPHAPRPADVSYGRRRAWPQGLRRLRRATPRRSVRSSAAGSRITSCLMNELPAYSLEGPSAHQKEHAQADQAHRTTELVHDLREVERQNRGGKYCGADVDALGA